jgi:hypothetical protein
MGQSPQTELYVDLPPGEYEIELAVQAFWRDRDLEVVVNGMPMGVATVTPDTLQVLKFVIPSDVIGAGEQVVIRFVYDAPDIPAEIGQSGDPRPLAVAVDWVRFSRMPSS